MRKSALAPALADLDKAAEIDPTNFYAYWNRGALRMAESDYASAANDFTTALSLDPDPASKTKIEQVLNVATEALQAHNTQPSEPGVITDPSAFAGQEELGSASAASSFPADAMPSAPALTPTLPASPMPAQVP
jgi:tetratricopeptide (TPR) repeat protein